MSRRTLRRGFGLNDDRFPLVLLVLKGLRQLWQERLKLMWIHSSNGQKLFGTSTKFAIERHRCWKLSLSLAYRATGLLYVLAYPPC